jgi:protein TonB
MRCFWYVAVVMALFAGGAGALPPAPPPALDWSLAQCVRPQYPRAALRAGVFGVTTVSFTVDAAGLVSDVHVEQKSGESQAHALLDAAAVTATSSCRFPPHPDSAPARATQKFRFELGG